MTKPRRASVEFPDTPWRQKLSRGPSEIPQLRSGFRLRAQTPAKRLNFDSTSLPLRGREGAAQEDRDKFFDVPCGNQTDPLHYKAGIALSRSMKAGG